MKIKLSAHPKQHPLLEAIKARLEEIKACSNADERRAVRKIHAFNRSHTGKF